MLLDTATASSTHAPVFADEYDFRLLNNFQRDFPLITRPFQRVASELGCSERTVLARLAALHEGGSISRVGAVFSPRRVGASTLAALQAPPERLDEIARVVSAHPEINHNYAREHAWNLWFVATAPDAVVLARVLRDIRRDTGCPVIALPLRVEFHIDLGFDLATRMRAASHVSYGPSRPELLSADETALLAAMQGGLPLLVRPFARIARDAGLSESFVLHTLRDWLARGIIKRFGVVVRHHELGFRANAMCVWDVPDDEVDAVGKRLAASDDVNLCYRRERAEPGWRYNLYCMIHGHNRAAVRERLATIVEHCALGAYASDVLFSTQRFKQQGARYAAGGARRG
ncbi:MAG: AsnC family transcriptional regulator [Rhodocyclaceae bacterium]|nr:AsnC family transcriptional regulator [Rhodocyclaceae bacterium]